MAQSPQLLLTSRRFLPQFLTQFFNALNDSIYKNAMVIFITYIIITQNSMQKELIVTLAAGIFILPFYLFSALAGQLADKYPKAMLTRIIKFAEIIFISVAIIGMLSGSIVIMMIALFLMGTHSSFFGPIKYAVLPELVSEKHLLRANALVEASTFIAILMGTLIGSVLILTNKGILFTSVLMLIVSISGWLTSLMIPNTPAATPSLPININFMNETWLNMKDAYRYREAFIAIIGISWFWLLGGTFLSQFPTYTLNVLHAEASVVSVFLSLFSVGIAIGSLLCNKLIKGEVKSRLIPLALLSMTPFICDLHFASNIPNHSDDLLSLSEFLSIPQSWRIIADITLLSVAAGITIVPLYTILQTHTDTAHRARIIACNNIINSLFMVLSGVVILALLSLKFSITQVFLFLGLGNAFAAIYLTKLTDHVLVETEAKN